MLDAVNRQEQTVSRASTGQLQAPQPIVISSKIHCSLIFLEQVEQTFLLDLKLLFSVPAQLQHARQHLVQFLVAVPALVQLPCNAAASLATLYLVGVQYLQRNSSRC